MELIHRTNFWGRTIIAGFGDNTDDDVDFDAIWTQFCFHNANGCCRGFGNRKVTVDNQDLVDVHDGDWNLFYVTEEQGRHDEHYFYKFVLIPSGTRGYGKKSCQKRGWDFVGSVPAHYAKEELTNYLKQYQQGRMNDDDGVQMHHVHLGIKMDALHT